MLTAAVYCEYPKTVDEFLELPLGMYTREWNHEDRTDPLGNISLVPGAKAIKLKHGSYNISGFSQVSMQSTIAPVTDAVNTYPGCCYVYDIQKWPNPPGPKDPTFAEFLKSLYATGAIAIALYTGPSIFECLVNVPKEGTHIAVGHQVGYVPKEAKNKVYARQGGGDSTYHLAAKISIYQLD